MVGDGTGQILQDIELLKIAGFCDRQEASGSQLAVGAAVAKADFSSLHTGS
jgi:hypothetical protein